jgi:hypothetical protein
MEWLAIDEDDWLTLYIFLFFVAFISGLALLAARSQRRRQNAYEPWHARLAAAEGKPRHDGIIVSKTSTGWVSGVLLSVVALAAIVAWARFFWPSSPDPHFAHVELPPKLYDASKYDADSNDKKGLRGIQAAQQRTTSGTKAINDSNVAEGQLAHDNASVAEQLKDLTHRDSAAEKLEENREHTASVFAKDSEESLRPETPFAQPSPTPAIPKRRRIVMRNWF